MIFRSALISGLVFLFAIGSLFALRPELIAEDWCVALCWMTSEQVPRLTSLGASLGASSLIGTIVLLNDMRRESLDATRSNRRAEGLHRTQLLDRLITQLYESEEEHEKRMPGFGRALAMAVWSPSSRYRKISSPEMLAVLNKVEEYGDRVEDETGQDHSAMTECMRDEGNALFDETVSVLISDYDSAATQVVYGGNFGSETLETGRSSSWSVGQLRAYVKQLAGPGTPKNGDK